MSSETAASAASRVRALAVDCVGAVWVDGGSVSLVSARSDRLILSATDATAEELERVQTSLGEGPCVAAAASLVPVLVADLHDGASGSDRWPFYTRAAAALDVSAVFAFPIRVSTVAVGTLGLYRRRAGALSDPQVDRALAAVDDLTEVLLGSEAPDELLAMVGAGQASPDGSLPVGSTVLLNQAAGMVMVQLGVGILEAIALLRATAYAEDIALADLASDVVHRRRRLKETDHD